MKPLRNVKLISAAIAAASLIAIPALGQVRVGQDGHSNDASNRVGSGGYNSGGTVYNNGLSANNYIYRNVTGLSGFQGPVGERDPGAFAGPVGSGISSTFVRTSSGVPTAYQAPQYGNGPTAFYSSARDVAPPIGTERVGFTGSYTGTPYTPSTINSFGSEITSALDLQRQTYGESTVLGVGSKYLETGNPAAQIDQGGPLEAVNSAGNYVGSPLYGLQGLTGNGNNQTTDSGLPVFGTPESSSSGTQRFRFNSSAQVDKVQKELLQNPDVDQTPNGLNSGPNQPGARSANGLEANNVANALESPNAGSINSRQGNAALNNSNIPGEVNTQQGMQQRLTLMSARQQSEQYNILAQRLAQLTNAQVLQQQQSARAITQIARARMKNKENGTGTGSDNGPASQPAVTGIGAETPTLPSGQPALEQTPLKIQSLADGIHAKGLHDLLASAEDLMRQGKYESAIQKYNTAAQAVPNNGLIPLGRANAELAAGYYYQASADLHQVFAHDPALLLGQYDIKSWIGQKRLQYIVEELQGLSRSDTKQETPAFLLAYITYNTGREGEAESYLKEARSRAGDRDPLLSQLESRWKLSASPALQGNK